MPFLDELKQLIVDGWVPVTFFYVVALPLWVPPVVMVLRSDHIGHLLRACVIGLAIASPAIALVGVTLGWNYCEGPDPKIGMGFPGNGPLWQNCPDAQITWLVILTPATVVGILAWIGAFVDALNETSVS
jgi:hypothetical protein